MKPIITGIRNSDFITMMGLLFILSAFTAFTVLRYLSLVGVLP